MRARLTDLMHLEDGRKELPKESHVELVPCAAPHASHRTLQPPSDVRLGEPPAVQQVWSQNVLST